MGFRRPRSRANVSLYRPDSLHVFAVAVAVRSSYPSHWTHGGVAYSCWRRRPLSRASVPALTTLYFPRSSSSAIRSGRRASQDPVHDRTLEQRTPRATKAGLSPADLTVHGAYLRKSVSLTKQEARRPKWMFSIGINAREPGSEACIGSTACNLGCSYLANTVLCMPGSTLVAVMFRLAARSFARTHVLLAGRRQLIRQGCNKGHNTVTYAIISDKIPLVGDSFDAWLV